jgi:hypothetical protein
MFHDHSPGKRACRLAGVVKFLYLFNYKRNVHTGIDTDQSWIPDISKEPAAWLPARFQSTDSNKGRTLSGLSPVVGRIRTHPVSVPVVY